MPLARGRCRKHAICLAVIAAVLMSGCAYAPSIGVLGAYFPDWLFCIVAGVALTVIVYLILKRLQVDHLLGPSALVYPTLITILALVAWLVLFQH
jgi:predicted membrane-bound dolichyl-phosphate-mannose-protein mannosyltransferase